MISRQTITFALGYAFGLFVAMYLAKVWDTYWGCFIGGCVMGLSLHIRFPVKRSKWYLAKVISRPILAGIAASAAYNIADWLQ